MMIFESSITVKQWQSCFSWRVPFKWRWCTSGQQETLIAHAQMEFHTQN